MKTEKRPFGLSRKIFKRVVLMDWTLQKTHVPRSQRKRARAAWNAPAAACAPRPVASGEGSVGLFTSVFLHEILAF